MLLNVQQEMAIRLLDIHPMFSYREVAQTEVENFDDEFSYCLYDKRNSTFSVYPFDQLKEHGIV